MKERPILFSGEMVRAILEGRKTMTRRVIKPQPTAPEFFGWCSEPNDKRYGQVSFGKNCMISSWAKNPYGQPGERLWVQEPAYIHNPPNEREPNGCVYYVADIGLGGAGCPSPAMFIPRWASRITLEVVSVRVERVQDISEEDAKAEGVELDPRLEGYYRDYLDQKPRSTARESFLTLWDSINAKRGYGWDANPWVWGVEFKKAEE